MSSARWLLICLLLHDANLAIGLVYCVGGLLCERTKRSIIQTVFSPWLPYFFFWCSKSYNSGVFIIVCVGCSVPEAPTLASLHPELAQSLRLQGRPTEP